MATQILMPALSPTMEEGKLAKWHVKAGDTVSSGDIIAEIETDKATMEFEAVDEGVIGKILVPEGTEGVKVRAPIAILLEEGEDASAADAQTSAQATPAREEKAGSVAAPEKSQEPPRAVLELTTKHAEGRVFASPLARRIAAEKGIDLSKVTGSGPRGRIIKADVENLTGTPAAAKASAATGTIPAAPAAQGVSAAGIGALPNPRLFYKDSEYEAVANDMMRKAIAKRLTAAAALIPHVAISVDCELDALLAIRKEMNAAAPKENGYKLSVNDFVLKASAMALMAVPEVNASWTDEAILRHKHADIGVAVALPSGLITPIVTHAEEKGLKQISAEVKELVTKAKNKKLKPEEYEGGSFSVSNLGMFGVKQFTSIVNPPQAAILSVGAGEERAVVKNGALAVATVMTVTVSLDHRVADGAAGARFLQAFKMYIEQPAMMLL